MAGKRIFRFERRGCDIDHSCGSGGMVSRHSSVSHPIGPGAGSRAHSAVELSQFSSRQTVVIDIIQTMSRSASACRDPERSEGSLILDTLDIGALRLGLKMTF